MVPVNVAPGNATYRGVTLQVFPHGNVLPVSVVLGTITHLPKSVRYVGVDVLTTNLHSAPRR